jgi:ADP-ribose pyrophosphatase YjhB (NUDIX family)
MGHSNEPAPIREKAMLVAFDEAGTHHAVSHNPATVENPLGYHRLIGGSLEPGETHRQAIMREVDEELGATIRELTYLGAVENIFRLNGEPGHEIIALYTGRLVPEPTTVGATLTESDGSVVPIVWRPLDDVDQALPLYPAAVQKWLDDLAR